MSDLINRIRQAQIRAAEDVVIGSLAPELIADPRDAALAAAPDSFVGRAKNFADEYAYRAHLHNDHPATEKARNDLFDHLTRPAAPLPEYTSAIGEAGQAYMDRFKDHARPLPGTFRWQELWDALRDAVHQPPAAPLSEGVLKAARNLQEALDGSWCASIDPKDIETVLAALQQQQVKGK